MRRPDLSPLQAHQALLRAARAYARKAGGAGKGGEGEPLTALAFAAVDYARAYDKARATPTQSSASASKAKGDPRP